MMSMMELLRVLDKKNAQYIVSSDNKVLIADQDFIMTRIISVLFNDDGEYISHTPIDKEFSTLNKKGAQWVSSNTGTLKSALPFRTSRDIRSLLAAIDR